MGTSPLRHRFRGLAALSAGLTIGLALSGCATGPAQTSANPAQGGVTAEATPNADPSAEASASETPSPQVPQAMYEVLTNQPTSVSVKVPASLAPGESGKVTVTVTTPNPGVPNGDVALAIDGKQAATGALNEAGVETFTVKDLAAGQHSIVVSYAGNMYFAASESKQSTIKSLTPEEVAAIEAEKQKQAEEAANNPCPPSAEACVDLTNNTTWLQKDGVVTAGPYKQIAGKAGHRTPPGTYTVQWKNIDHKSSEFDGAPMPYAIFFNGQGMAFHVGSLSTPSHGCVHLSESAAKVYWDALQNGDVVYIYGTPQY